MKQFISQCLLIFIMFTTYALANDMEQQEIVFRENPQTLYEQLMGSAQPPFSFTNLAEFEQLANQRNLSSTELIQQMILLARLNLETNLYIDTKYDDAQTLIDQLDKVVTTPLDKAVVIMLKGRIKARVSQKYQYAINQYNDALNKVSTDVSLAATLFKFTIHEHLSSLHGLILQPTPALTHLNRYREIAYQLRNDYFIASAELMLGRYYNRVSEQAKSLQHYTEAFRVSSRTRYSGLKAMAQLNLARTYRDLDQWDEALKHAHDAAISFQELGRGPYVSEAFVVIAMTYAAQEKWNKAIDHYLNAQQINEDLGNELAQALANHNIAEAYYNLNNPSAALTYINMANEIFRAKNVKHYLVANESLYAQILIKQQMWPQAIEHANQSLAIAREKGLIEQELESLKHLSTAYRNSGELNLALDVIDNIIALTQAQEKQKHETNSDNNTELTEQKLKFELGLQQAKLSQKINDNQQKQFIIILLIMLCIIMTMVLLIALSRSQKIIKSQRRYKKLYSLDPMTELNGLRACIQRLKHTPNVDIKSFALIKIDALTHIDVNLGMSESMQVLRTKISELSQLLDADIYVIKPGQIACCFNHTVEASIIYQTVTDYLRQTTFSNPIIPSFHSHHQTHNIYIGHIHLPLLANHDVYISPELHFETTQFALGTAMTQQQSTYVSLKTLNFAPAAIFSAPLYLNLTQAMKRGIIKAESNQLITEDDWPK